MLLIVAISFDTAKGGATKTKIMRRLFFFMLVARTNVNQHCSKNCLIE
jgi:hypothetical protein